ncbi:MAG: hypothetical protein ACYCZO_06525 [Daejeonella sp.]
MLSRSMILMVLIIASCNGPEQRSAPVYVDLKKFFEGESARFEKLKVKIDKSVSRNGISESKYNISADWKNEFGLFIESDINKPAWKNSYRITVDNSHVLYTALDSDLRTRSILLKKNAQGRVVQISIVNQTRNSLYNSTERLSYALDSTYNIFKQQDIALLGKNEYKITGTLKKRIQ